MAAGPPNHSEVAGPFVAEEQQCVRAPFDQPALQFRIVIAEETFGARSLRGVGHKDAVISRQKVHVPFDARSKLRIMPL